MNQHQTMSEKYKDFKMDDFSTSYLTDSYENHKHNMVVDDHLQSRPKSDFSIKVEFSEDDYLDDAILQATEYFTKDIKSVSEPKAMYLISQPGLNKNSILKAINKSVDNNSIIVKIDQIKKFHPEFKQLSKKTTYNSQRQLNDFANDVYKSISSRAIADKKNIIFDSTFVGTYNMMEQSMQNIKSAQTHKVEINALSLNQTISSIGIHFESEMNYQQSHEDQKQYTPPKLEEHDKMYHELPTKIEHAIKSGLIDSCKLYGIDILSTSEVLLDSPNKSDFKKDFIDERDKILTLEEIQKIEEFQKHTESLMIVREASIENINEFNNLINETKGSIAFSKKFLGQEVSLELQDLYNDFKVENYNNITIKKAAGLEISDQFIDKIITAPITEITNQSKTVGLTIMDVPQVAKQLQNNWNKENKPTKTYSRTKTKTQQQDNKADKPRQFKR